MQNYVKIARNINCLEWFGPAGFSFQEYLICITMQYTRQQLYM